MIKIKINTLPIELYKVIKIANLVGSGGESKFVISEGLVYVNGEIETRKGKKINNGDIIEFEGDKIEVLEG